MHPVTESGPGIEVSVSTTKELSAAKDLGAELYQEAQGYSQEELKAESQKIRRKIDWHIIPLVCKPFQPARNTAKMG